MTDSGKHSYGLDWLDENELFEITKKTFAKALNPTKKKTAPPDPFTLVAYAVVTNNNLDEARDFEAERAINKTLSNEVGLWHQHVLGLADGWEDLGAAGGGVDLRSSLIDARYNKPIIAEVKNRFNTIKASDEKKLWDQLDMLARSTNSVAYVFQIVPEKCEQYDRPWNVSGREPRENVRCCDGVTAYNMVFKRKNALQEIYGVLPDIFSDVTGKATVIDKSASESLYYCSFPLSND